MPRIWAIGDTHLSFANPKPMDIFGEHWRDHPAKIAAACAAVVEADDLLLIPGDISWALKRKQAEPDLEWLAALPGTKVLVKGNHDYWWDSDRPLKAAGLYDTPFQTEGSTIGIAGTRGWYAPSAQMSEVDTVRCNQIISREAARLEKRLQCIITCDRKFVMLHYPPLPEFAAVLSSYHVQSILYGHVHLAGSDIPLPPEWHGMRTYCVAADRLHFKPMLIGTW